MRSWAPQLTSDSIVQPVRERLAFAPAAATLVAAAIAVAIQTLWIPLDADVSWLITVCERVLAGDRLYIDILEVNPPASVWLYLPAVWVAALMSIKPEAVVATAFIVAGIASVAATLRLATRLEDSPNPSYLTAALAFVAMVLPMGLFAQREHAALLLALPCLTGLAVIAQGKALPRRVLYACGAAAGLIVIIKPYFLLAVVPSALWAAWRRRSLLPLMPGVLAAAASIAIYALALLTLAKPYFDWLNVIVDLYAPVRSTPFRIVAGPSLFPAACLALAMMVKAPRIPSLTATWALGSVGFVLAAIAQGKNYPNHWLPGAALALLSLFVLLLRSDVTPLRRLAVGGWLGVVALAAMYAWVIRPDPAIAMTIERIAPPGPKIIALSPKLISGHPVTRNVGGRWVGSRAALYVASGARSVGLSDAATRQAYRDDLKAFAHDVENQSPDVVLVHRPSAWLLREQEISRAMRSYRPAARVKDTDIWLRRELTKSDDMTKHRS